MNVNADRIAEYLDSIDRAEAAEAELSAVRNLDEEESDAITETA